MTKDQEISYLQIIEVLERNPAIVKQRDLMNKVLANGLPIRTIIHPRCKNLTIDMEFLKEDPTGEKGEIKKKKERDKTGAEKYGHVSDSWIYFHISAFNSYFDKD